jgi:hypothetical protein
VKGDHCQQKELDRPAVGEKEMQNQKNQDENGRNPLQQPGPHARKRVFPDFPVPDVSFQGPFRPVRHDRSPKDFTAESAESAEKINLSSKRIFKIKSPGILFVLIFDNCIVYSLRSLRSLR